MVAGLVEPPLLWAGAILAAISLVAWSWIAAGVGLAVAATGRKGADYGIVAAGVLGSLGVVALVVYLVKHPEKIGTLIAWIPWLEWAMAAVVVFATGLLLAAGRRRRLLAHSTAIVAAGVGGLILAVACVLAAIAGAGAWHHFVAAGLVEAGLAVAPILGTPLALDFNRHR